MADLPPHGGAVEDVAEVDREHGQKMVQNGSGCVQNCRATNCDAPA
jgi:hypothetical protein